MQRHSNVPTRDGVEKQYAAKAWRGYAMAMCGAACGAGQWLCTAQYGQEEYMDLTFGQLLLLVASYIAVAGGGAWFGAKLTEDYIRRYYK
jgi:drug/metabolite transporter (DMT)-like permease